MASLTPEHPRLQILFYIAGDEVEDEEAEGMEQLVATLAASRTWSIGPPEFVDDVEEGTSEGDVDLPLVGCVLETSSRYPPWGARLPAEIDRAQLDEMQAVVSALCTFSREYDHEIVIEYNGDGIGAIVEGVPSKELQAGFLADWERRVALQKPGVSS